MFTDSPPPLIFNVIVVFLNPSNHRKCVKKEGKLGLKHMLGFLLAGNKRPNVIACTFTHMHTHVFQYGSKCEPGDTVALRTRH